VASGHVGVEGLDGISAGDLTVLLVHVVGAGTRIVTDPDTEVLNLERALLVDLQICVNHVGCLMEMKCNIQRSS
jgi:hypothetical protein